MISVIMGVYNAADTVLSAVRSILEGTYRDLELIVCDDASEDGSAEVLSSVSDDRLTVVSNERNMGLGYCLAKCAALAKGEFIARMDADDVSHPDRLRRQIDFLDKHREYAFCGSAAFLVWEGKKWGKRAYPAFPTEKTLLKRNPFVHPTVVFRRAALEEAGGYSADLKYLRCEDYELFFRLYEKKLYGANLEECLFDFSEPPFDSGKHTFRTRRNECRVRREGGRRLRAGFRGLVMSFYPLALYFTPKCVYKRIRARMWTD